jgi:hypothetical protein
MATADYKVGLFLGVVIGLSIGATTIAVFTHKNTLKDYCGGEITAMVVLESNDKKGTLYIHCAGTIYESDVQSTSKPNDAYQVKAFSNNTGDSYGS